jgi:hypothetical protein
VFWRVGAGGARCANSRTAAHNVKAKTNASQPSQKTGKVGGLERMSNTKP